VQRIQLFHPFIQFFIHPPSVPLTNPFIHPGCVIRTAVNGQTELARIYNDQSVMENHHCAMTWAVLSRKDCALLVSVGGVVGMEGLSCCKRCVMLVSNFPPAR
jgi:hypothetical protein